MRQQGRLFNSDGEIIAEGDCEFNGSAAGEPACRTGRYDVTMWTPFEQVLMERQLGPMTLVLEDGAALEIAEERRLKFRVNGSGGSSSFIYRMRAVGQRVAPDAHPPSPAAVGPPLVEESLPARQEGLPAEGKGSPTRL